MSDSRFYALLASIWAIAFSTFTGVEHWLALAVFSLLVILAIEIDRHIVRLVRKRLARSEADAG